MPATTRMVEGSPSQSRSRCGRHPQLSSAEPACHGGRRRCGAVHLRADTASRVGTADQAVANVEYTMDLPNYSGGGGGAIGEEKGEEAGESAVATGGGITAHPRVSTRTDRGPEDPPASASQRWNLEERRSKVTTHFSSHFFRPSLTFFALSCD